MAKRIGVLLSGCGVYDGSEIYETVITLLALDKAGALVTCMAPKKAQMHVIDHSKGEASEETRCAFTEAARLARGVISDLAHMKAEDFDGLILPGGFGAAKNLSSFATEGAECSIDPETQRLLSEMFQARKPVGAMCIAPAVIARHFKGTDTSPKLTIGTCEETQAGLVALGATHEKKSCSEISVDESLKLVTTPAYMLAGSISEAAVGIEKLVSQVIEWA